MLTAGKLGEMAHPALSELLACLIATRMDYSMPRRGAVFSRRVRFRSTLTSFIC